MSGSSRYCSWVENRIESYIDEELDCEDRKSFERHIETCDRCRRELSRARVISNQLHSLPIQRCPGWLVDEVASFVGDGTSAGKDKQTKKLRRSYRGFLACVQKQAAVFLLVLTVAVTATVFLHRHRQIIDDTGSPSTIEVSQDELELAKLDAMLALAYVKKYSRHTGDIIKKEGIDNTMEKLHRSIINPKLLFHNNEKEEI